MTRLLCSALFLFATATVVSTPPAPEPRQPKASPVIVIGFVGGFVKHDNAVHSEVQLAARLRQDYPSGVQVEVFENHRREKAHEQILRSLDIDKDGALSAEEKQQARIIIYGHSWGASETVALARELEKDGIPVLLTIQVDSISKSHQDDMMIPANVSQAANFYQTGGGWFVDSYHPKKDAIVLSRANFDGTDIGALAIAAHETGHVLQAHWWFVPYCFLKLIEPAARIALGISFWLWLVGSVAESHGILRAAAAMFGTYLLYLILELICEFDASRRGVHELVRHEYLQPIESRIARRILRCALATYFAAFAGCAAATIIFLLPIMGRPIRTPGTAHRAQPITTLLAR